MNFALKRVSHRHRLVIRDTYAADDTSPGGVGTGPAFHGDDRRPVLPSCDSTAWDTLFESFPHSAFSVFDDWSKQAASALNKLGATSDFSIQKRREALKEFVEATQHVRALVQSFLPSQIAPHAPEQILVAELIQTMEDNNLLYREKYLFEIQGSYVRVHNSLESKLLKLSARAFPVQTPVALAGLVDAVHEQLMLSKNVLRFNMAALQFDDATVQLQDTGIHYSAVMPVVPVQPVIPRTCISQKLCMTWSPETWNGGDLVPPCLLPLLGAALRPPGLRTSDLRSVCLLLTSSETAGIHPVVWAIRQFGGFAVVDSVHEDDMEEPKPHQPFILFIDAMHKPLTMDDCVKMEIAVRRRMTVVINARSVPLMFAQEHMEFMRFVTVHMHRQDALSPDSCAPILKYLLHAMTVAYSNDVKRHRQVLSYLSSPESVPFRLVIPSIHKSASSMFVEMLQSHAGIRIKAGDVVSWADVEAAFAAYQRVRYPRDETSIGCSPADVLHGYQNLRTHFGYLTHFPDVVFNDTRGEFVNMCVCEW
jgi:hypothetical protein